MRAAVVLGIIVVLLVAAGAVLAGRGGGEAVTVRAATIQSGISLLDVVEWDPAIYSGLPISFEVVRLSVPPQVVDALIKGDVDIAVLPVELGAVAMSRGADAYIIALDYDMNQAILVRGDSELETPADLAGRRIAAVVGSGTYAMFKALMEEVYGLTVGEGEGYDVQVVALAPPQVLDALARGDVDAAVIWEPLVSQGVNQHGFRVLASLADLWREYIGDPEAPAPMLAWVAGSRIVDDPEVLEAVLEAHERAAEKWVESRDWIVAKLQETYNLPGPVAELVYKRSVVHTEKCIDADTARLITEAWKLAVKAGYLDEAPSPDRIITCQRLGG